MTHVHGLGDYVCPVVKRCSRGEDRDSAPAWFGGLYRKCSGHVQVLPPPQRPEGLGHSTQGSWCNRPILGGPFLLPAKWRRTGRSADLRTVHLPVIIDNLSNTSSNHNDYNNNNINSKDISSINNNADTRRSLSAANEMASCRLVRKFDNRAPAHD